MRKKKQLFYETMEQCEHVTRVDYQQTTMLASGGMQRQAAGACLLTF